MDSEIERNDGMVKRRRKPAVRVAVRAPRVKRRGRGPQKTATIGTRVDALERQHIEIMGKPSLAARVNALEGRAHNVEQMLSGFDGARDQMRKEIAVAMEQAKGRFGVMLDVMTERVNKLASVQADLLNVQNGDGTGHSTPQEAA
jgi:hypothetical protein